MLGSTRISPLNHHTNQPIIHDVQPYGPTSAQFHVKVDSALPRTPQANVRRQAKNVVRPYQADTPAHSSQVTVTDQAQL